MNTSKSSICAALIAGALSVGALTACGGGEDDSESDAPTHTVADVTACFEDAGQKVREVEVSFAKIPPDLDVSGKDGSANVWIADDENGVAEIIEQDEALSQLGDPAVPDNEPIISGNAVADISSTADDSYATVVEECLPPTG